MTVSKALNVPVHATPVGLVAVLPPGVVRYVAETGRYVIRYGGFWGALPNVLGVVTKCEQCDGTGRKPTPEGWDQGAHLDAPDRTCECHDSWDQCPCADDGHSPGCGCCPGGTGLCGPLPCEACDGTGYAPLRFVKVLAVWPIEWMAMGMGGLSSGLGLWREAPMGYDPDMPTVERDGHIFQLPDAEPGGVALHVKWTDCPTCDHSSWIPDPDDDNNDLPCPTCRAPFVPPSDAPLVEVK